MGRNSMRIKVLLTLAMRTYACFIIELLALVSMETGMSECLQQQNLELEGVVR